MHEQLKMLHINRALTLTLTLTLTLAIKASLLSLIVGLNFFVPICTCLLGGSSEGKHCISRISLESTNKIYW